jgi:heptosyltransferase-2
MVSALQALVRRGMTQPIAAPVAADDERFLAVKGTGRVAFRVARRQLEVALSGQGRHECAAIDPAWRRGLWIHAEAPQIGDALMDLAPRSLLAERGIALDLLAAPASAALFAGDAYFGHVLVDADEAPAAAYDFAIVDSRCWKALAWKRRRWPRLPWVSLKGDYLAYDYHRGLLATRRLAALLGMELDGAAEARHAQQKLRLRREVALPEGVAPGAVALALGGVRAERSYAGWPEVAARLHGRGVGPFVLLGSGNGEAMAREVRERLPAHRCVDLVGRTDLHTTRRAMVEASVVLAADGGLMHLALTTPTPLVALFDASIDPAWRLPPAFAGQALRANEPRVSAIAPEQVEAAALAVLGRAGGTLSAGR